MTYESERQTRKRRIDPQLEKQGWRIIPYNPATPLSWCQNCAIEEFPTANGPADYALCVDGKILGVLKAKKISLGPQNVLTRAERYARGLINNPLNFDGFRAPFLYSTNGEIIWFHDVRYELNRSRKITQFHIPDALREMFARDLCWSHPVICRAGCALQPVGYCRNGCHRVGRFASLFLMRRQN